MNQRPKTRLLHTILMCLIQM